MTPATGVRGAPMPGSRGAPLADPVSRTAPLRVAALTAGATVPSARFRVAQYRAVLAEHGVALEHRPSRLGAYPPRSVALRPAWLLATLAGRVPDIVRTHAADVTLLQRELVSTLGTLEGLTARPRVLDVDDAVWLLRGGAGIRRIAGQCDLVICGNEFLADYFRRHAARVAVLPTAVDTTRYRPADGMPEAPRIVWTGGSGGFADLLAIEEAIGAVLAARPSARLRVVADRPPPLRTLPPARVEFVPWSPGCEVAALQQSGIGIMPLRATEWARGKCSYKMLLYMACGLPVVVSPVGMNVEVLAAGDVGIAASGQAEWIEALIALLDDPALARRLGEGGRRLTAERYALPCVGRRLAALLHGVRR